MGTESSLVHRTTPEQEPPPAYHDLFPPDFVFEDKRELTEDAGETPAASTSAGLKDAVDDSGAGVSVVSAGVSVADGVSGVSAASDEVADRISVSEDQTEARVETV